MRAQIKERHGIRRVRGIPGLEPADARTKSAPAGFRRAWRRLDMLGIAKARKPPALGLGERSTDLPDFGVSTNMGLLVIKAIGTDAMGRRVAAWAALDQETAASTCVAHARETSGGPDRPGGHQVLESRLNLGREQIGSSHRNCTGSPRQWFRCCKPNT